MKRKEFLKRLVAVMCFSVMLATSAFSQICYGEPVSSEEEVSADIEIRNVEEFFEFLENCKYDSFSIGKTVSLVTDLDLIGVDFDGVAYFNGIFEGNGHTITNLQLKPKGSDYGFFRYVGESGIVRDLHIAGEMEPTGSQENIGGIAGVNYGTITDCSFEGSVCGIESVGAIAGINKATGNIVSCSSTALVLATNYTGGIAGTNEGVISACKSESSINIEELEPTLDLAGMDVSSFNVTRNVVNRNDMGGIAGYSSGLITDCVNEGVVGYKHTGYNAGGIVGGQCGIVLGCTNKGEVYGRKDIGGIAGQAEPYVESEYLEDKVNQTKDDINRLNRTLNNITSTMKSTSSEVKDFVNAIDGSYNSSINDVSGSIAGLSDAVGSDNPEAQGYVDNINAAWNQIESIKASGDNLTEEQAQEIQNNLNIINSNLGSLQGTYNNTGTTAEDLTNSLSGQLSSSGKNQEIKDIVNTVDNGVQSVTRNMESAIKQLDHIATSMSNDVAAITSDEEIITDISSVRTAADMDGVISGCKNYGKIQGDLNVGGIAGTMNIEYDGDPEFDFDFSESLNITLRSTVNDVVIHCVNYGEILAKKNCAGGAIGLQELGLVYDSEGYGTVSSDSGNYLGGVAGRSSAAIEKSYSLCNITGTDYVGGICGKGYTVKDSISVCDIESDGEYIGSVAGYLEEEGTAAGNRFVNDELHGIDNISYAGTADKVSYEDVMATEGVPDGFHRVTIVFETEDAVLGAKEIPYGGSIDASDFPDVEEKEGFYVRWANQSKLTDIRKNLTVTAEYVPWQECVASKEETESGKPVFLAVGEFYENTSLTLETTDGPVQLDENAVLAYAYSWNLSGDREKDDEKIEAHLIKPETEDVIHVWVRENEGWNEVFAEEDGSYLVIALPYGADVAVVTQPEKLNPLLIVGGAAAVILAAGFILWKRKKKKAQRKDI